jgi:hypothetical protein
VKIRRYRSGALLFALVGVSAFLACELNPQPLPPQDNAADEFGDASSTVDARSASTSSDSGLAAIPGDFRDGGDASSEAGDASSDADAN